MTTTNPAAPKQPRFNSLGDALKEIEVLDEHMSAAEMKQACLMAVRRGINLVLTDSSQPAAPVADDTFVGRWTEAIKSLPMDGAALAAPSQHAAVGEAAGAKVHIMACDLEAEQTFLGSSREACSQYDKARWDRLQRAIDHLRASPLPRASDAPTVCQCGYDMETACNVLDPTCKKPPATAAHAGAMSAERILLAGNVAQHAEESSILAGNVLCKAIMEQCARTIRELLGALKVTAPIPVADSGAKPVASVNVEIHCDEFAESDDDAVKSYAWSRISGADIPVGRHNLYLAAAPVSVDEQQAAHGLSDDVLTPDEVALLAEISDEFEDCGETSTEYAVLMDFERRGYLECSHFEVSKKGRDAIATTTNTGADHDR